jgi:hypothetical protein
VLNVIQQVVIHPSAFFPSRSAKVIEWQAVPRKATNPPHVFHWFPIIGSAVAYGTNPIQFLFDCRTKVSQIHKWYLEGVMD